MMAYDPRSAPAPHRAPQEAPAIYPQDETQDDQIASLQEQVAQLQAAIEALQSSG
jgi:hypothetical protein